MGGTVVAGSGRSSFLTGLLAMGAQMVWLPGEVEIPLGDYLTLRTAWNGGSLLQSIRIPTHVVLGIETVGRTPGDQPILCVAICRWPSGRTRVALGGYGQTPILALDGPEAIGSDLAVKNAYSHASDQWASADYRSSVAAELVRRLLAQF